MQVTRRFWLLVTVVGALAGLSVIYARPVVLFGSSAVITLLFFRQYQFLSALRRTDRSLRIDQTIPTTRVRKGERTPVTLSVTLDEASSLSVRVDAPLPVIAQKQDETQHRVTLPAGSYEATTTTIVSWPVVGRTTFSRPTVTASDPLGLFKETLPRGEQPIVTVQPRTPQNVHVGEGGDAVVATYGGHRSGQFGPGIDPAEIRQYTPGDSVNDIDWKATARLDYPHVREYEVETDRQTILVVDHRQDLTTGPKGETKLDYLREVALSLASSTADLNDPLGLATVDDGGTVTWEPPGTTPRTYHNVETALTGLETASERVSERATDRRRGPGQANQKAALLARDDSTYSQHLQPFLTNTGGYVRQLESDPLFKTVRTQLDNVSDAAWIAILTDDSNRAELRETVKLARQRASHVGVFITPTVLFEERGLTDMDAAYETYVEFEEFRRELARIDNVNAFEVGPGDRIEAILAAGNERHR